MARGPAAADALGFAVRKGVRNNLVREVDRARHRQMWETAWVVGMLLAIVLCSVWLHVQLRDYGYEMRKLEREQAVEDALNRQLKLRIETMRSPARIEDLATRTLKMIAAPRADSIVIERVTKPASPPKSAVALRQQD
jgi:cell division protein FtsL